MKIRPVAFVVAAFLLVARVASAQQTFTSLAGPWWFSMGGKDAGALLLELSEPNGPAFTVTDVALSEHPSFGFSRALGGFYQIAADQPLALDAKGNLTGSLVLHAPGGGAIGTLTLVKGKPSKKFDKLKLSATLDAGAGPLVVKLTGVRPTDFPVLSGHTAAASLSGKGAKSKTIDVEVSSDTNLGLPAYAWTAHGPLDLDKTPIADTTLSGHVMVDPKFKAYGVLEDSSDLGTGLAKGKLKLESKTSTVPKFSLVMEAARKIGLKARLGDPIEPVLSVTPINWDFGALHLDDTVVKLFSVANVGVGTLSGAAAFVADTVDFQLIGSPAYTDLAAGDPPVMIAIAFNPQSEGGKNASVRFGLDTMVGARMVTLKGTGGIPVLFVDHTALAFDDTVAGNSDEITVMVRNDGDAELTGKATLSGASAFTLLVAPGTLPVSQITYSLAAGASKTFVVHFRPSAPGDFTGTLKLTGANGANLPITGSGI